MGIVMTYAVNDRESYNNIVTWMKQIKSHASENVCKILVANKCDVEEGRVISTEEGKQMAEQLGVPFFETSAQENINVAEVF